jgi:serine/threonine protein kinase
VVAKGTMRDAPGDVFEADSTVAHRYRVIAYRGDRGFGQVYEAEDTAMDRRVALMRLRREFSRPDTRESFYETRSTAAVGDPRIVDLSDYGEDLDGRLFLVMPWIEDAEALDELLDRNGALGWPRARALIEQMASALEAAHRKGVLHGGLEPSRVLVDSRDHIHIVDFGLAPALTRATRDVTLTGPLPGKVEYLSPEQVRGEDIDARTDIYALAVILWELLAGTPPFVGGPVEVANAHLDGALPHLPRRGPSGAPAEIEALLHLSLAKDRGDRLASASQFLELLRAIPASEAKPTLARTTTQVLSKPPPAAAKPPPPAAKPALAPTVRVAPVSGVKIAPTPTVRVAPSLVPPAPAAAATPAAPPKPAPAPSVRVAAVSPAPAPASVAPPPPPSPPPAAPTETAAPTLRDVEPPPTPTPALVIVPPAGAEPSAGVPRPIADTPKSEPLRSGVPPPKRKLGPLELALIVFLAFDVLLFAAWKLFLADSASANDEVTATAEEPRAEPAPQPQTQAPAAEPVQPVAVVPEPEPVEAPSPRLSAEEAIAAVLPPEPDTPGPVRPAAKSLSDKVFREAMIAARGDMLKACLSSQKMRRTLKVAMKVAPSGQVEYARVVGGLGETALGQCVVKHVYQIEFPITHEGGSHTYTLRLR